MSDFKEKDETFIFKPEKDEKPLLKNPEEDRYSKARIPKPAEEEEEYEEKNSALVIIAITLAVILVATIIVAIMILKKPGQKCLRRMN